MIRRSRRGLLASLAGVAALGGCTDRPPGTDREPSPPKTATGTDATTTDPREDASPPEPVDLDELATRWAVRLDGPVIHPPTVAADAVVAGTGTREFGTPTPGTDPTWTLAALSPGDGAPQWTHDLPAPTSGAPRSVDGAVFVPTGFSTGYTGTGQRLVSVEDGQRAWASEPGTGLHTLLAVDDAGRAYLGTGDDAIGTSGESLFAVNGDDGSRAWTVETGDAFGGRLLGDGLLVDVGGVVLERRATGDGGRGWRIEAEVLTEPDGTIPVVDDAVFVARNAPEGERFAAVDVADGAVRWTFDDAGESPFVATGATVLPEVTIGTQHDSIVVGTEYDGVAFGLAPLDGGVLWRFETGGDVRDGLVAAGERVFLGDLAGTVYALDATDGSEVWRADSGGPVGSLGVAGDTLVVRSGKGSDRLLGLDRADGSTRWSLETDEDLTRPALGDDVVAVGSETGMVRLLGP